MAVENYSSTEVAAQTSLPRVLLEPDQANGTVHYAKATFTQAPNAGDIASTQALVILPAGRFRILPHLSRIAWSAFGASRTLNVGHTGYTQPDGTVVAAAPAALASAIDVANAGASALTAALDDGLLVDSLTAITLQSIVAGGTIPAGATLKAHIAYVRE